MLNTSGTSIPSSVTLNTGTMLVAFVSNSYNTAQGFTANYTSVGSAYCSGTNTLNSADHGTITDGSGGNNYCNNMNCQWLIQPPQATSVTLNFSSFDVEPASTDGESVYDAVEVYNGITLQSPLLGRFSGNNLPSSVTSTGGSLLVRFYSDISNTASGWSADYTSTSSPYCNGQLTLTAPSGNFSDGSGVNLYSNNSNCSWLIQPTNASSITLSFISFNTEQSNDGVIVYDGANNTAPILGQFSGASIPSSVTSSGGSMYVEFLSGTSVRGDGWVANYTSTINPTTPLASFSTNKTTICAGDCINFFDSSTNFPTDWSWTFREQALTLHTLKIRQIFVITPPGNMMLNYLPPIMLEVTLLSLNGYITVQSPLAKPLVSVSPSNTFCQGDSAQLTILNPCSDCNYFWSPTNQIGSSIQVSTSNTFSVNASNSCNQITYNTVTTFVKSKPSHPNSFGKW